MLYIFDEIESFTEDDLAEALAMMPPLRRDKALSYRFVKDRCLSVIAYLLLKEALHREYGIESFPRIDVQRKGKPYFPDLPHIHFNLSHCSKAVVCAVSDTCVGIDVEDYDSYHIDIARHVLNDYELSAVEAGDTKKEFARFWTIKESYLKYTGDGLTDNIKSVLDTAHDVSFCTIYSPKGYACSICTPSKSK